MKTAFVIACLLFSQASWSNEITWLGAVYVDTLNKTNIKGGIVFKEPYEYSDDMPHYYGSFNYADIEVGLEGYKLSMGIGSFIGHGLDRIGLSYAQLKTQDLAGFEAIVSQMGMSFKFGYYLGLDNSKDRWLLGIGLGF